MEIISSERRRARLCRLPERRRNLQVFRNVNFFTYIKKTAKNSY